MKPALKLKSVGNLWTLTDPQTDGEWDVERKIAEIAAAGFDAVTGSLDAKAAASARRLGLDYIGWFWALDKETIRRGVAENSEIGATQVTTFLGRHDTSPGEALELACFLEDTAQKAGLYCASETHRDTAMETPEKTAALLSGFRENYGYEMPVTWDFSHHAVVKHLPVAEFRNRLLTEPAAICAARLFHFRPFNGHHAQVPVTSHGAVTPETKDFLDFVGQVMALWFFDPANEGKTMWVCPEIGPISTGYSLSFQTSPWEEACTLRELLQELVHAIPPHDLPAQSANS